MHITSKRAITLTIALMLIISGGVLVGWAFRIKALVSYTTNMTAMNPLTAVCFMLIAIWLALNSQSRSKIMRILRYGITGFIFFSGFSKLCDYWGSIGFHVDKMLFASWQKQQFIHNAMAPTTALLFCITACIQLNAATKSKRGYLLHDVLLMIAFLLAYLGALGYIYSLEPFYRIGPFVPMALNTCFCFILALLGMFLSIKKGGVYGVMSAVESGGRLSRKAIPFLLLIPPLFGYIRIIMQHAAFYTTEYGIALDTAFIVILVLTLIYYYARALNKQDQEKKSNQEKYRSLVYSLKEGVVYYSEIGTVIFYNKSICDITGYGPDELIGRNVADMILPSETGDLYEVAMNAVNDETGKAYETRLLCKDGVEKWVHINARRVQENGVNSAFFSTITDISERKKQQEDIEAFSSSAAHDLNSPLARIELATSYLLDYNSDHFTEEDIECLKGIQKTSVDTRNMLKDLLQFSKIGAERMVKQPVDMQGIAAKVAASSMYLNPVANMQVDDLPAASGDPSAIKHVWDNLILNAVKYSSKKENARIEVGSFAMDGKNVYYVKDNGAGFDMAKSTNLFSPFNRLHTDFEGNGLGLPIAKRIVEKHGGKIWATAEKEHGATFYFTL
jgi:PAS domain S-box-containing protein